jgi:hypothetical protein
MGFNNPFGFACGAGCIKQKSCICFCFYRLIPVKGRILFYAVKKIHGPGNIGFGNIPEQF